MKDDGSIIIDMVPCADNTIKLCRLFQMIEHGCNPVCVITLMLFQKTEIFTVTGWEDRCKVSDVVITGKLDQFQVLIGFGGKIGFQGSITDVQTDQSYFWTVAV